MKAKIETALFVMMVAGFLGLMVSVLSHSFAFAIVSALLILFAITANVVMVKFFNPVKS